MSHWDFRRAVRLSRSCLAFQCPLGVAMGLNRDDPYPDPLEVAPDLGLEYEYCQAVASGFDGDGVEPSGAEELAGDRYGRRMRIVATRQRWRSRS